MQREFTIHVLGFREDGLWCALALDLSLRGYGETFEEAQQDLAAAVEAQISFALQHGTLDEIWQPAEPEYFEIYQNTRRQALETAVLDRLEENEPYALGYVRLPRARTGEFKLAAAT